MSDPLTPAQAGGDKPPGAGHAEPLGAEVSRAGGFARTKILEPPPGPVDPPPPAALSLPTFVSALQSGLPGAVEQVVFWVGDWSLVVSPGRLLEVASYLRHAPDAEFDACSDVTATDWPPRAERFDVIYSLYSTRHRHRVRLKARVAEGTPAPSVSAIWPSANWLEREVFDLFGIRFDGHPDLRRILMPDEWQGHPQRKDYPLEGPGELVLENPMDWLRLKRAADDIE
jgi:NADH-quinone oxidoreductase subunit C